MYRTLTFAIFLTFPSSVACIAEQPKAVKGETETVSAPGPDDPNEKVKPGPIDAGVSKEFTRTESGLRYRVLRKGKGGKPEDWYIVDIHYKGWLDDNTIFTSSYRTGKPNSHPVDRVIKGWTEGLKLIGKGGMIELDVPPDLGYGKRETKGTDDVVIPANSRLHFIIELFDMRPEIKVF